MVLQEHFDLRSAITYEGDHIFDIETGYWLQASPHQYGCGDQAS
jgi:hypothetical protein